MTVAMNVPPTIYGRVRELAQSRTCDTYSNVGGLVNLDMHSPADRRVIGAILSEINRHEHNEGRPLMSAVVVRKGDCVPGNGFDRSAVELGRIPPFVGKLHWRTNEATRYWEVELKRVHDYWSPQ
jgi:hypothetical protein